MPVGKSKNKLRRRPDRDRGGFLFGNILCRSADFVANNYDAAANHIIDSCAKIKPMADEQKEIPKIRTLKTDVEEFARGHKASPLDMAAKAYAQKDWAEKIRPVFSRNALVSGVIAVVFIIVAGYLAFQFFRKSPEITTEKQPPISKFLPVENEQALVIREINPGALLLALLDELKKPRRADTVIYFPAEIETRLGESGVLYVGDFVKFLNFKSPAAFLENLLPEFNALAVYEAGGGNLGIIFKTKKFEGALAALLLWEPTMWLDFRPFLKEDDIKNISKFSFHDEIIKNNDARVLKNGGKIILGYSIFNKQYIIISTSSDALSIILERLITLPPR